MREIFQGILNRVDRFFICMKNFLKGYGTALTLIPSDKFPRVDAKEIVSVSDSDALKKDWEKVGGDIRSAIKKFELETKN